MKLAQIRLMDLIVCHEPEHEISKATSPNPAFMQRFRVQTTPMLLHKMHQSWLATL